MPFSFDRILLATQATEFDVGAERVAIELAARCGTPLLAVMPLDSNLGVEMVAPLIEEKFEAEAAAGLERLRQAAQVRGVTLLVNVRRGEEPYREIVAEAADKAADLLVLRRRGKRSYLANLLLGEMVHTVTGHAPCDVLIVPRAAPMWSRHVLLATDGSAHSQRAAQVAAAVAARCGLPMTVVSAIDPGEAASAEARTHVEAALEAVRSAGVPATGRVVAGKASEAIIAAANEVGADLIVIGRRGLNRARRLLVGSTSERVAGAAPCPVMIVRA
jgi:hypothetical protein